MRSLRHVLIALAALALVTACETEAADPPVDVASGGTQVRSDASTGNAGGAAAGGAQLGGTPSQATDAALPPPAPEDAAPPPPATEPPPPPPALCEGDPFAAVDERVTLSATGLTYQGLDGNANPLNALIIEIRSPNGEVTPGVYDLAGTNFRTCEVCVLGLRGCNPMTGACNQRFYPRAGEVEITELGADSGERFTATLRGIDMVEVDIDPNSLRSFPVDNGDTWCNPEQAIDLEIATQPARLRETVREFSLQNCETEEFVSMYDLGATAKGLWFIATAGWCPACAEFVPNAIMAFNDIERQLGPDALKPVIILGENANYGRPTLAYCKSYAARYDQDAARFYIDHDGTGSFATTFQYIWPYPGADGSFGLPWNALVRGRTFEYFYSDRSGESDLNTALNALLQ